MEAKKELDAIEDEIAKFEAASRAKTLYVAKDWDMHSGILFPEYSVFKSAVRMLGYRAEVRASDGDLLGALNDLRTGWRLSHLIGSQPTNMAVLVGLACESLILRASLDVAGLHAYDAVWISKIREEVGSWTDRCEWNSAFRGDAYLFIAQARNLDGNYAFVTSDNDLERFSGRTEEPLVRSGFGRGTIRKAFLVRYLEHQIYAHNVISMNADNPHKAGVLIDRHYEETLSKYRLSDMYTLVWTPMSAYFGAALEISWAMPGVTAAALRAGEIHAETGAWPSSWEELGLEPVVDAITGMPALLSTQDNSFVISLKKPYAPKESVQNLDYQFPTKRRSSIRDLNFGE